VAPLIALTGFMGSGKTSVGRAVAAKLRWDFVDLDAEIAQRDGISIEDFFSSKGEEAFRTRECQVLGLLLSERADDRGLVLALGGGTLENHEAVALLRDRGDVAYLETSAADAWSRVQGSGRPLARDRRDFERLLAKRQTRYEAVADWIIPVGDRTVEQVAADLLEVISVTGPQRTGMWSLRTVSTGRRSLILGGRGALSSLARLAPAVAQRGGRLFVITDENVMRLWGDRAISLVANEALGPGPLVLASGEASKSVLSLEHCWDWLADHGARRDDTVVAFGGGVVGDVVGFSASTYHRGISLWQIPTSLLAQVDSSVGGKTAINLKAGKNLAGTFYQPDVVLIDPNLLCTLPDHEYKSGLGEVIKYGLLHSESFFARLEKETEAILARDPLVMSRLAKTCVGYKTRVVEEDELDKGRRAVLNLGHTLGHALELTQGYGVISHGRAVALGILVSLAVSERLLGLDPSVRERTRALMARFALPTGLSSANVAGLLEAVSRDKKVVAGSSGYVGLRAIGDPAWGLDVPPSVLGQCLEAIRA
jgi:shikimate kinase / 3-dehydroquinate synthase